MRYHVSQAEASFHDWERKRKDAHWKYWTMLKRAKVEYLELTDQVALEHTINDSAFYYYLQQNFGIQIELIDGKIGRSYNIVDDHKHLMFLMKYGS